MNYEWVSKQQMEMVYPSEKLPNIDWIYTSQSLPKKNGLYHVLRDRREKSEFFFQVFKNYMASGYSIWKDGKWEEPKEAPYERGEIIAWSPIHNE